MSTTQAKFEELYAKALAASVTGSRDFDQALALFVEWARTMFLLYYETNYGDGLAKGNHGTPNIEAMEGQRYVRIVSSTSPSSRNAWGFVDRTTGNIMKADGWKRPAPQKRGSIFEPADWKKWIGPHGPAYLK
jgi:hypothetical protein